jgi:DNA-binding IclR family transcriptional regulator
MNEVDASAIGTIHRAGRILRALSQAPRGLTLSALAGLTDLPKSTVHRLVKALQDEQLVAAVSDRAGFRLGAEFLRNAASINGWLVSRARPELLRLSEQVGESVDLAFLIGDEMTFVDQVVVKHRLQAVSTIGAGLPLYCTASGKALLQSLPDPEILRLFGNARTPLTRSTIVDSAVLLEQVRTARIQGLAFDREEQSVGVSGIAILVPGPFGLAAAIGIPVPTARFIGNEGTLGRALLETRRRIIQLSSES